VCNESDRAHPKVAKNRWRWRSSPVLRQADDIRSDDKLNA
jgi:hypothetical protein